MPLALTQALAERPDSTRRFLRAALAGPEPNLAAILAAGVPHWDASDLLRRLSAARELDAAGWSAEARAAYQACLAEPAPRPSRTLDGLAEGERPREKALRSGIETLDDPELLALILRTGTADQGVIELARRLVDDHGGLPGLARQPVEELARERGLGPAKASELAAAFELARRLGSAALRERPELRQPELVAGLLAPLATGLPHEEFWCLPCDPRLRLIGEPRVVSRGDVDGTDAPPRAFFRLALQAGASGTIAVHNHPSGDPGPSAADRALTRSLVQAGRLLGLPLHDHLILGDGGRFTSLRRDEPGLFA